MTTLKEMCEQAYADEYCSACYDDSGRCTQCVYSAMEKVAKAFAEKALWQHHGGVQSAIRRSGGSAMFVESIDRRIAYDIVAAEKDV